MKPQIGPEPISFECNICGEECLVAKDRLQREVVSCQACGSTPRVRAIIRTLSLELFGRNLMLPDFPVDRGMVGLGMTDWEGYASRLSEKFTYANTYYHQEPKLDIAKTEIPDRLLQCHDFIISSEVFEHIVPPVNMAFKNTFEMLKPGGVFVLTVPYGTGPDTIEHFPELHDFSVREENESYWLRNITQSGNVQEFRELVFHGGAGATLEMRVFAEAALFRHFAEAGFESVTVHRTPDFEHGIWWPEPWALPFSARRPK